MSYLTERQKTDTGVHFRNNRKGNAVSPQPTGRSASVSGSPSYGTAYKHLKLLQQKGFLRRDWNQKTGHRADPRHFRGRRRRSATLPYFGRIAAGRPIEALSGNERVTVPGHLLRRRGAAITTCCAWWASR